jgi:hypothetical protein
VSSGPASPTRLCLLSPVKSALASVDGRVLHRAIETGAGRDVVGDCLRMCRQVLHLVQSDFDVMGVSMVLSSGGIVLDAALKPSLLEFRSQELGKFVKVPRVQSRRLSGTRGHDRPSSCQVCPGSRSQRSP